jgi:acetyl-CoA carboxylase carboxyltransferase component
MSRAPFPNYQWTTVALSDYRFLESFRTLYGTDASVELFHDPSLEFTRISADGIVGVRGKIDGRIVSAVLTDFRVGGGSFGRENMVLLHAFMQEISLHDGSLVFILNTLGVRFTDGRSLFSSVFQIFPDLLEYRKNHLFVAVSLGKCLGLGALFFGQAHYRIAAGEGSLINLTGPEVVSLFFGGQGPSFDSFASAGHQKSVNSLIHEIQPDSEKAILRARQLVAYPFGTDKNSSQKILENDPNVPKYMKSENALVRILDQIGEHAIELYPQLSSISRTFLIRRGDEMIGLIANPPLHPNNLVTTAAIDRTQAAMDLFRALQIPIISAIDSPGGDPRASESDSDMVIKMVNLVHTMIEYPFGKMGLVTGRCYGGSCMFAFPKIYGSLRMVALKGSNLGVMSSQIISKILSANPRMHASWIENTKRENSDLSDMVANEDLDAVVAAEDLSTEIGIFLELVRATKLPTTLNSGDYVRAKLLQGARVRSRGHLPSAALQHRTRRKPASAR